jgi:hypothetical protein
VTGDTQWNVYPLSNYAREAKARALGHYTSQMEISGRFLSSFVRTNELFVDLPATTTRPGANVDTGINTIADVAGEGEFGQCETAAAKLYGDNLARYVEPSGDITDLGVAQSAKTLTVRLSTRGPVSTHMRYTVLIRSFVASTDRTPHSQMLTLSASAGDNPVPGSDPHNLQVTVPLSTLGFTAVGQHECVWVSAESRLMSRLPIIDRTGYREFDLCGPKPEAVSAKKTVIPGV